MKRIISIITAVITAVFCSFNSFAYDEISSFVPNTGEDVRMMYVLIGLMALAVIALVVVLILRKRSTQGGKHTAGKHSEKK